MKHIISLLLIGCLSISLMAQNKEKYSKQEFRAKKEAYLKEKAGLTDQEAKEFFPLYFQLEDLKKDVNGKAWAKARTGENPNTTEEEYENIINTYFNVQVQAAALDKEYIEKFRTVLSAKKIYMIYRAEIKFNRNMLKIMHPQTDKKE